MINRFDGFNVTWGACQRHAAVYVDAFATDPSMLLFFPQLFPAISEAQRCRLELVARAVARQQMLKLLRGTHVLYNLEGKASEGDAGSPVRTLATCLYALQQPQQPSRWYYLYKIYFKIIEWWEGGAALLKSPDEQAFRAQRSFETAAQQRQRHAELENEDDLGASRYPRGDCVWLSVLAVPTSLQGRGYGRQIYEATHADFRDQKPRFGARSGPAKIGCHPSQAKGPFYHKLGFQTVLEKQIQLGGEWYPHQMLQMLA